MLTRNILPREGDDPTACRMCALEREHFSHIYECSQMVQVFRHFAKFAKEYVPTIEADNELICLGLHKGVPLPQALSALHIVTWKFAIIEFTQASEDSHRFDPERVWTAAVRRYHTRLLAYEERQTRRLRGLRSRGQECTIGTALQDRFAPLATIEVVDDYPLVRYTRPLCDLFAAH